MKEIARYKAFLQPFRGRIGKLTILGREVTLEDEDVGVDNDAKLTILMGFQEAIICDLWTCGLYVSSSANLPYYNHEERGISFTQYAAIPEPRDTDGIVTIFWTYYS